VANALTALFFARGQNAAFVTVSFKNACTTLDLPGKFPSPPPRR
jgi:hydroxymethylglutaryl-CoA reductase (NADPH)